MAERECSALGGDEGELLAPVGGGAAVTGISVFERWPLAMVQVTALDDASSATAALRSRYGLSLPAPGASGVAADLSILWCGPMRWLVVGPRAAHAGLAVAFALAAPSCAIVDLSHARTVLRLTGPRARDVLAKGSAVDFHPRALPVGACAATAVARLPALVHLVDDAPTFDLYVPRSFGRDAREWLASAASVFR